VSIGRAFLGLLVAFAATIVAARLAFDATSVAGTGPVNEPWAQARMEFVAWNDQRWTAWIRGAEFELVPKDTRSWSRHSNVTLAFIDWEGEPWQAKIDGDHFVLAHRGDWQGPTESAAALRYRDWSGRNQLRTLTQLRR
jgi:hypothetical protein